MRARAAALACLLAAAPLVADEQVPLELLDFVGSFATADGKWIDPTQLEVVAPEATKPRGATQASPDAEEKNDD